MVNQINNLSLTQSNLPSGGSRGGVRPPPPLFLDQTEVEGPKKISLETAPFLSQGFNVCSLERNAGKAYCTQFLSHHYHM